MIPPPRFIVAALGLPLFAAPLASGQAHLFRTIDGSGNNPTHTEWGSAGSTLLRDTAARYDGDMGSMMPMTNARAVSNAVGVQTSPTESNAMGLSSMFWQWGQFIDHDITLTTTNANESYLIDMPAGESIFGPTAVIPMNRSNTVAGTGETTPREYANANTAWLDASMVYGSDDIRAAALRSNTGGRLAAGTDGYMIRNTAGLDNANDTHVYATEDLFLAGDIRANEQVGLTAMHEVFFRFHNSVADQLLIQNPTWDPIEDDELIYQTTRKIVGASVQKITYEDWLPAMLGGTNLDSYAGYNPTINPGITAEFSTAIFRFGHTMLNEKLVRLNADGSTFAGGDLNLSESFFNPNVITETGSLDAIVRGLVWQASNDLDTQVVEDVRSMLFGSPDHGGLDLLALNIQRGRDHGIGTFNDLRTAFGLTAYTSFAELTDDTELAAALASVYASVDDVDMWIGLMSEDAAGQAMLGETLTIAMIDQFERLRDGDRFYYENDAELLPYLSRIQSTSLCDILAGVTGVSEFTGDVFLVGGGLTAIPEPGVLSLLAIGGMILLRRRSDVGRA